MNLKKATIVVIALYVLVSCSLLHADQQPSPDPADLTSAQSFIWAQGGMSSAKADGNRTSTGVGKLTGGISGAFNESSQYLGLLEQGFNNDGTADTRGRLFTVFDTGNNLVSNIGVSVDYIRNAKSKDTTTAFGIIGKVETPVDWMTIFPNLALVESKIKGEGQNLKSKGYQFNLFNSFYIGDSGLYSMVSPQYTKLNDLSTKKLEISFGGPLTDSGQTWWDIKAGYTKFKGKRLLRGARAEEADLMVGISHYF